MMLGLDQKRLCTENSTKMRWRPGELTTLLQTHSRLGNDLNFSPLNVFCLDSRNLGASTLPRH